MALANLVNTEPLKNLGEDKRSKRRAQLREFQSQLLKRVELARISDVASSNQLGVMIGQTRYLLNLREAGEIVSVGKIYQIPLTQKWYLGLLNIRGNLIGVVDIDAFQDQLGVEMTSDCRVITFSDSLAFNAGLVVTKVLGLRNVAEMKVQPQFANNNSSWIQRRYLDTNNQVWHELSLTNLINDSHFLHIGV